MLTLFVRCVQFLPLLKLLAGDHHLWLCALLAYLDGGSHIFELFRVLHRFPKVFVYLDFFTLLLLELLKLKSDLLLLLGLLKLLKKVLQEILQLLNNIEVKDRRCN